MNDRDHEQWKDVESRHEQSITPRIWQLLNKLRSPSILQTKEMSREEKMLQILSLEKGSFTSHVTTISIVKEELIHLLRSNVGVVEAQAQQRIVGVLNERSESTNTGAGEPARTCFVESRTQSCLGGVVLRAPPGVGISSGGAGDAGEPPRPKQWRKSG